LLWFAQSLLGEEASALVQDAMLGDLNASTKADAIREIAAALVDAGAIDPAHQDDIVDAILAREKLGSTAIGRGFAVPHARHASVDRIVGAMAVSRAGIDFDALDRELVYIMILLVSPTNPPNLQLRALEKISRNLRHVPSH